MTLRPTAESVLESGIHGRQRREEREIQKIDLQRARRYGIQEPARNGRVKYTYGGIVFIYDPKRNREITSYKATDMALKSSGTMCTQPIILTKKQEFDNAHAIQLREATRRNTLKNKTSWTSHSVLVVDMSGSMRRDDVNGARCRSDGVWMALARDYVKEPLTTNVRSSRTDLISVVLMRDYAEIIFNCETIDWVLYNKFIDLRHWTEHRPSGPGNYMPALDAADDLLMKNHGSNCSLSLMFFSDGRPSDYGDFPKRMGKIAAKFGRRLSVACIGMAEKGEDFSTLSDMVDEATSYGAVASFGTPSLDADSLSNIITGLASSLTTSKTEMTNMATGEARKVRMDIKRERVGTPDDEFITDDWNCYNTEHKYVEKIWSWSTNNNEWVGIIDTRCILCYSDTREREIQGGRCTLCKSCYFCKSCYNRTNYNYHRQFICSELISKSRRGALIKKAIPSFRVAIKKPIFGEGAERIVRKFRFLDKQNRFIGPVMVAKESRFVDNDNAFEKRMDYHEEFMRTQSLASEMAKQFNNALDKIPKYFKNKVAKHLVGKIPKIEFLEPLVVQTIDPGREDKEYNVLVEPMLEGTYEKFNDNMGMVRGKNKSVSVEDLAGAMGNLGIGNGPSLGGLGLGAIVEVDSEEEEDDDSDDELIEETQNAPDRGSYNIKSIKDAHIPQSFSHFTYEKSKRYFMVVDLQGVLAIIPVDGTKCYKLTDPVIHKRRKKKKEKLRKYTFGRTDRGEKGMKAFFHTHQCNDLCRLLGLQNESE